MLLAAGAGGQLEAESRIGLRPLHVAADYLREAVVEQLLQQGASVHARSEDGETPLCSCLTGLTKRQCAIWDNPDASTQEQRAQAAAATAAATAIAQRLLAAGADVNVHFGEGDGPTPLHYAAQGGPFGPYCDLLRMLLAAGADPRALDMDGRTPLDMAMRSTTMNPQHLAAAQIMEAAGGSDTPGRFRCGAAACTRAQPQPARPPLGGCLRRRASDALQVVFPLCSLCVPLRCLQPGRACCGLRCRRCNPFLLWSQPHPGRASCCAGHARRRCEAAKALRGLRQDQPGGRQAAAQVQQVQGRLL